MKQLNLQITAKCNFNCKHCFNAADNAPLLQELRYEEICQILDAVKEKGIDELTITGGEPMLHKDFLKIMDAIYARGMTVFDLNTNGYFITREMLDHFKEIGCDPLIKISFDGLGYHDWMRGTRNIEAHTLEKIRLCLACGFRVMIQYNVNRTNLSTVEKTVEMFDEMGCFEVRLIRTTESARWAQNAPDGSLTWEEYYDLGLQLIRKLLEKPRKIKLVIWQFASVHFQEKYYQFIPVKGQPETFYTDLPLCDEANYMLAVAANGDVYPCLQFSGTARARGIYYGNILTDGLDSLLKGSSYHEFTSLTVEDRIRAFEKCRTCRYLKYCCGGCPALALLSTGNVIGYDLSKCIAFEKGYFEKLKSVFPEDWYCTTRMSGIS